MLLQGGLLSGRGGGLTGSQSQPEGTAVPGLEGVVGYVENTLRRIHAGGEGGHGEEGEGGRGQHHVTRIQQQRHAEEDVGEQPAAEGRPAETSSGQRAVAVAPDVA